MVLLAALFGLVAATSCSESEKNDAHVPDVPNVVTADIQAGIEKHIEEQSRLGEGYFELRFDDRELYLKLVRVHVEYLANLGPRYHFACVDLGGRRIIKKDVDFFLRGDPGSMTVTETTVHKINGQPLYAWEQKKDKTWHRVPIEQASAHLLGVIRDRDEFEFRYKVVIPELTGAARMWIPLPVSDDFQTIMEESILAPGKRTLLTDSDKGNRALFLELGPEDSGKQIDIRYQVQRLEKSAYIDQESDPRDHLRSEGLVPVNEDFQQIAEEVLAGEKGELVRARALYDHVIDRMSYKKYGEGWGKGDAVYACDARTGNCTDFHSYFIALARAAGIPARFAIGAPIPSARDDGGISGYHCWADFYAEGKWWPVDISEGDKYSSLATYYFGHHPANRVELSRGRDLLFDPAPASGPINFFAYPVLEVEGESVRVKPTLSFERIS
jgi:transglutaminase-like putative cysteine protease